MRKLKIIFVINYFGIQEPLSIPIISAIAKARGHQTKLIEFKPNPKKAYREIRSFAPDIVAYCICSNEHHQYLKINRFLKRDIKFFSLFGGPHPTFYPSFIEKEGVDGICKGEGDICFPQFLEHFGTDKMYEISNFSFKAGKQNYINNPLTNLIEDLDSIPFPDRELIYSKNRFMAQDPVKFFMAGRGCPYKCSYCFNHTYNSMYKGKGKVLRTKSVTYLLNEIKNVVKKYPVKFVKFFDDIFGINREWLVEFSDRYPKEINMPFGCYTRPNIVTKEHCQLLKKAGCYSISMAIESGNQHLRNFVLNRNITDEQIFLACEHIKRFGIRINALNMIGLPGETEREIFQTIEMNQQISADFSDTAIFQPYPGTQITEYCKKKGYLDERFECYRDLFTTTILNFDEGFKNKIYVLHKLFPILVDYPKAKLLLNLLYKLKWLKGILNFVYRFYYGFNVHRRIYGSPIPFRHQLHGAIRLLFSRERI